MKKSDFQFTRPAVTNLVYTTNENFNLETNSLGVKYTVTPEMQNDKKATVELSMEIGEQNEDYPFFISITIKADFKWEDEIEDAELNAFLKANAPALLISYIRPIITIVTASSKYPAFNLPFLDLREDAINANEPTDDEQPE